MHKESEKIRIKRGVRQGTPSHPSCSPKGVKIDGEFLSNLRFADDIFLCTQTPQELQQMLQELSD